MEIARAEDGDVQVALADAYEKKVLPGNQMLAIRRIIEQRRISGKSGHSGSRGGARVWVKATVKYRRIAQSIPEIGVIEPLAVAKSDDGLMLLDGHIRYAVLVDLGETEVRCLLARDDEASLHGPQRMGPLRRPTMPSK